MAKEKNSFKPKEEIGVGLTEHFDKIREEIRKRKTVQARLTQTEKYRFEKLRKKYQLTESAFIRKLINEAK